MISYIHFPVMAVCFFGLIAIWRFWKSLHYIGYMKEVSRRDPTMLQKDILAAAFAMTPFFIAIMDWSELSLPRSQGPIEPLVAAACSVGSLMAFYFLMAGSKERFNASWAGSREAALRTVVALRIIDASVQDQIAVGVLKGDRR